MASENTGDGIGGTWAMISGCTADRNGGTGISAACQRTPRETRLHANGPSFFGGAVITSCHATGNGEDGIAACSRSLVTNSNALGNGTRGIFNGINVGRGSMVSGCISNGNSGDGIQVVFESAIVGNTTNENGVAGIHAIGAGIRVEGNQLIRNVRGIVVEAAGNTIFKNTARDNAVLNYDIVGGNDVGPIGCAASCVSPWANLEF
jgi:parallel beta-helix repeat protein